MSIWKWRGLCLNQQIKVPIAGNVCVNTMLLNITDIDNNEGVEVLIFKNQLHKEDLVKNKYHSL